MERTLQILKDAVENTHLPIGVYTGEELRIEVANPAMINTLGKGGDVIGRTYFEVVPEIEKQHIFHEALQAYRTGVPFHARDKRVDLIMDGEENTFYFNYSFIPLFDAKGKVYGVMNTGMDVTELHLAREQAQSASEQLRMAVESSGMGTYEIDLLTGNITTSGNFRSIWNIQGTVTNDAIISRLHPEDIPVREEAHRQAEHTGVISYQARIINEDQSVRWTSITGKILRDETGAAVKITGIIEDIGCRKALEQQLREEAQRSNEELRRSNEELLHFANLVSHDLKEPVRKIKTFISRLRDSVQDGFSEKQAFYLDKIDHTAQRMGNVIEGILAYSGADKKKRPVEAVGLNEVLEQVKGDLELAIEEKDAVLIIAELPEIEGSKALLQQLFYNLVHNALKFSRSEEPPRIIIAGEITEFEQRPWVRIRIQDNGIGIEKGFTERVFKAFERLHSKDQYEGSGLGLSLCRKITERHGGNITVSPNTPVGSVFTVMLPLKQAQSTI
ncbi:PAS domain-containing sensor histidine kinase [Flavobacterium ustbae]|uniref:PAS domain-containing sensor histidine kinase n=1 Tax=Flavobacterium ustbae TaxID=2488790 RepID=UPI000F78C122|nr:ATP-binding protein [Flavobacterium ustbae]